MKYPLAIQNLIDKLSKLPSVGPKTAERYVFYLLRQPEEKLKELANAIQELKSKITVCQSCLALSESNPCPICNDKNRSTEILCVVENIQDLAALEATKQYNGRYFILGGLINTIDDIRPEDLNIEQLLKKIKTENIKEIILALNFTLEGETTSLYLNKLLKDRLKITRLAKGLPAGSDLEYADEITLANALKNRS
ncbi:MAG: recombination mediator RecR [Patescibacteria group bacterium]|jgi:recombination protein RecR